MSNSYLIYRVVCSTPPGLEEERDLFLLTLSVFAEQVTMVEQVLFAPATFRTPFDATVMQAAVKENIKDAFFFLTLFGEDPVEPVYKHFVQYAIECQADPGLPMRRATVFFKESQDVVEETRALRERFAGQCDIRVFHNVKDLEPQLRELMAEWLAAVKAISAE